MSAYLEEEMVKIPAKLLEKLLITVVERYKREDLEEVYKVATEINEWFTMQAIKRIRKED